MYIKRIVPSKKEEKLKVEMQTENIPSKNKITCLESTGAGIALSISNVPPQNEIFSSFSSKVQKCQQLRAVPTSSKEEKRRSTNSATTSISCLGEGVGSQFLSREGEQSEDCVRHQKRLISDRASSFQGEEMAQLPHFETPREKLDVSYLGGSQREKLNYGHSVNGDPSGSQQCSTWSDKSLPDIHTSAKLALRYSRFQDFIDK